MVAEELLLYPVFEKLIVNGKLLVDRDRDEHQAVKHTRPLSPLSKLRLKERITESPPGLVPTFVASR